MNEKLNWNDLQIFIPIAKSKSFRKASDITNIHYTTLARRLSSLEEKLGCKLIIRSKHGLKLTKEGEILYEDLEDINDKIIGLKERVLDNNETLKGKIRLNLARFFSNKVILPHLQTFKEMYPEIDVEIIVGNAKSDLNKHEADVGIWVVEQGRIAENLVGRNLGSITTYIYGTRDYIEQNDPENPDTNATMIGDLDGCKYLPRTEKSYIEHVPVGLRLEGVYVKAEAAAKGHGLAKLPVCIAEQYKELVPVRKTPCPLISDDLWVFTHPDLKKIPRIKCFIDFITEKLKTEHPEFWLTYE